MRTFEKQSWETWDYDLEMRDWFNELDDNDYITSLEVTCEPAFGPSPALTLGPDLQPDWVIIPDKCGKMRRGKVWIGYGTDQIDYVVTVKVFTFVGRRDENEFKIRVRDKP